jgi:hypothetical protein
MNQKTFIAERRGKVARQSRIVFNDQQGLLALRHFLST